MIFLLLFMKKQFEGDKFYLFYMQSGLLTRSIEPVTHFAFICIRFLRAIFAYARENPALQNTPLALRGPDPVRFPFSEENRNL